MTLIQRQMPVFTQQAPAYDVLVAADESEVFAAYLPYRTWDPRPVAGSAGPGADELGRGAGPMGRDPDAEPLHQAEFAAHDRARHAGLDRGAHDRRGGLAHQLRRCRRRCSTFIKSAGFRVAAFKGQRLTLRDWNLQLRQPILLVDGRMVVSVSPQEGFLHQVSELDTLGIDRPETKCKLR